MKGLLIVNMGGPQSEIEMKFFLANMFKDKTILPYAKPVRMSLSWLISTFKYKKSWKKYELIGGTPIIKSTISLSELIKNKIDNEYIVEYAFSYSHPLISDSIKKLEQQNVDEITVVPLYPHYSISTWQSVVNDAKATNYKGKLKFVEPFYKNENYIQYFTKAIENSIKKNNLKNPLLLFSAHSIPNILINKGDYYESEINASSKLIAEKLNMDFTISYQSQIGKKWLGPVTENVIEELYAKGTREIIIIPISFVGENLETLYDIDKIIIEKAKNNEGLNICSMKFCDSQELLAQAILDEIA